MGIPFWLKVVRGKKIAERLLVVCAQTCEGQMMGMDKDTEERKAQGHRVPLPQCCAHLFR